MVQRRPDLFRALIGANVLAPDPGNERYQQLLTWAREKQKTKIVRGLEHLGPEKHRWPAKDSLAFSKLAITASTDVPDMVYDLMLPALMYDPTLTMGDIRSLNKGMSVSLQALQPEYRLYDYDHLGQTIRCPSRLFRARAIASARRACTKILQFDPRTTEGSSPWRMLVTSSSSLTPTVSCRYCEPASSEFRTFTRQARGEELVVSPPSAVHNGCPVLRDDSRPCGLKDDRGC